MWYSNEDVACPKNTIFGDISQSHYTSVDVSWTLVHLRTQGRQIWLCKQENRNLSMETTDQLVLRCIINHINYKSQVVLTNVVKQKIANKYTYKDAAIHFMKEGCVNKKIPS